MGAPTTERPLAVVTGASSGNRYHVLIAAEDAGIAQAGARLRRDNTGHRKMAVPGSAA